MDDTTQATPDTSSHRFAVLETVQWRAVVRDILFIAVWVALVSIGWGVLRWPARAYYVVVFGGIVAYSLISDPWTGRSGQGE